MVLYLFATCMLVTCTAPIIEQRVSFPLAGMSDPPRCITHLCEKSALTTVVWAVGALTLYLPSDRCILLLLILPFVALTVVSSAVLARSGPGPAPFLATE